MSSTNKTSNLGLNQWILTDPLLMEDMNADNRKIDTAVGANPYVKLLNTTLSAHAQQVDLDLSSIDLTKYSLIKVLANVKVTPLSDSIISIIRTKINNGGGMLAAESGNTLSAYDYIGQINSVNNNGDYATNIELEIMGVPDSITAPYLTKVRYSGASDFYSGYDSSWHYVYYDFRGVVPLAANTKISTVNITSTTSGIYIAAGSKFEVYGVKK